MEVERAMALFAQNREIVSLLLPPPFISSMMNLQPLP